MAFARLSPQLHIIGLIVFASVGVTGDHISLQSLDNIEIHAKFEIYSVFKEQVVAAASVREHYSNQAKRAKLTIGDHENVFDQAKTRDSVDYYYDDSQLIKLSRSRASPSDYSCKSATALELFSELIGDPNVMKFFKAFYTRYLIDERMPSHVIGLGRLVMLAEVNMANMKQMNIETTIRNHRASKYELADETELDLTVYMGKMPDSEEDKLVPLRIISEIAKGYLLLVDYFFVNPQRNDAELRGLSDKVGLLTFPLGYECARDVSSIFKTTEASQQKIVSFRYELIRHQPFPGLPQMVTLEESKFVAYDGWANALRVDTITEAREDRPAEYSIMIHDMSVERKYFIRQSESSIARRVDPSVNSTLKVLDLERGDLHTECYATFAYKLPGSESSKSSWDEIQYEPLLPTERLLEMGRAVVRGVSTRIFEHVSSLLPPLVFSQLMYKDQMGKQRYAFSPELKSNQQKPDAYTIDYYVADAQQTDANSGGLGQLMRIDVFRHQILLFRVEVHDFLWQLADAPNGDKQDELFSLQDRCSSTQTTTHPEDSNSTPINLVSDADRSSPMELELIHRFADQSKGQIKSEQTIEILRSAPVRNKALVRALSTFTNNICASQVYDIRSKLEADKEVVKLKVALKFVQPLPRVYKIKSIGAGIISWRMFSSKSTTFEQCFWEAARERFQTQKEILFSFCRYECVIDLNPTVSSTEPNATSVKYRSYVFDINEQANALPCNIMTLEYVDDDQMVLKSPNWWTIFYLLQSNVLSLPLVDSSRAVGRPVIGESVIKLLFKPKQIQINDRHWMRTRHSDPNSSNYGINMGVLDGLALGETVAHLVEFKISKGVARVEQEQPQEGTSVSSIELVPPMDASSCQLTCLMDAECHSYSVCLKAHQVECQNSALDFYDSNLIWRIKVKLNKILKEKQTDKHIRLEVLRKRDKSESNGSDIEQPMRSIFYELDVDRRCRIYNKRTLDLFNHLHKSITDIYNRNLFAATDEEECAEMCLNRNLEFLTRMSTTLPTKFSHNPFEALEYFRGAISEWCSYFKYLNIKTMGVSKEHLELIDNRKHQPGGLCYMEMKQNVEVEKATEGRNQDAKPERVFVKRLETFKFKHLSLFELQRGVRLLGGIIRDYPGKKANDTQSSNSIAFRKNEQVVLEATDAEQCALRCFVQSINSTFLCRSFEFFREQSDNPRKPIRILGSFCVFNALTIEQALTEDANLVVRIDNGQAGEMNRDSINWWHYEPSASFHMNYLNLLNSKRGLISTKTRRPTAGTSQPTAQDWNQCFLSICLTAVACLTGLLLTYVADKRFFQAYHLRAGRPRMGSLDDSELVANDQLHHLDSARDEL